jgi:hypothetical protein
MNDEFIEVSESLADVKRLTGPLLGLRPDLGLPHCI